MDTPKANKYDLNKYCKVLAKEFSFVETLNSEARQVSAERAWSAIARFYDNCKKKIPGKKGYPKFKKNTRSVEYRTSGWKLDPKTKKHIVFSCKKKIGRLKLVGSKDIYFYNQKDIRRVRLVRRADGYYCQFLIAVDVKIDIEPTRKAIGLDVGLKYAYADSNGHIEPNPRFYRTAEKRLKKLQKRVSKRFKKGEKKQSNRYKKAKHKLAKTHLKVSRQREEWAKRIARCVCTSADVIVYEDLKVKNMLKNHKLAKSISDIGWYQLRKWLEYFGVKFQKITIAVSPHFTSINCSNCGEKVEKTLSTRTHECPSCKTVLDRDINAAINILRKGLSTTGHVGTWVHDTLNAQGEETSTSTKVILLGQVSSVN
jgi:putative transposase